MLRKIDAMYKLYGCVSWRTCKDCPYLIGYDYHGRHYYKCKAYGDTASEATDWRLYYHACGLIVMGMPTDHIPVLDRLKHGARGNDDQPIPGQITMFDEKEDAMPRLIDADVLMSRIENSARNAGLHSEDYRKIKRFIATTHTIDAELVRHGRWVWHEAWGHPSISEPPELLDEYWMCSACGTDLLQYLKSHFPDIPSYTECTEEVPTLERCPHCGAKMDGGEENDCK